MLAQTIMLCRRFLQGDRYAIVHAMKGFHPFYGTADLKKSGSQRDRSGIGKSMYTQAPSKSRTLYCLSNPQLPPNSLSTGHSVHNSESTHEQT